MLVTGSSGCIGSRLCKKYLDKGIKIVGIDLDECPKILKLHQRRENYLHCELNLSDTCNLSSIKKILMINKIKKVIHLAASIDVAESEENPALYYKNNLILTINLLESMKDIGILEIYFSSTAAVYSVECPIEGYIENDSKIGQPISVYGKTKLICETLLQDYSKAYGFKGFIFRFFNIAGAQDKKYPPHHLLPIIINKLNENEQISIYGDQYKTRDGTCIRDYIHVNDIISAFELAIDHRLDSGFQIYNIGSNIGISVKEMIREVCKLKNIIFEDICVISDPRKGDPALLIANCDAIKNDLGWGPKYSLEQMIYDTINDYQ